MGDLLSLNLEAPVKRRRTRRGPSALRRSIFAAAASGRLFDDWITSPLAADQEIQYELRVLRARCRSLARDDGYAEQYLNLCVANVVGPNGFRLKPLVRNNSGDLSEQLNDKIKSAWQRWCEPANCTVEGQDHFVEFQQLVCETERKDGEAFIRIVRGYDNDFNFALELIDADRIDETFNRRAAAGQNEIRLGVEVNAYGRPLAYHILTRHPSEQGTVISVKRERVPVEEIIHFFRRRRSKQGRGIPSLQIAARNMKILDGYVEAELVAARAGAAKMGFLKTDAELYDVPEGTDPSLEWDANPGVIKALPPGMEFQSWTPDHPSAAFPPFMKTALRKVAAGLSVPYNTLASDLEGVNFSSIRQGELNGRDQWKVLHGRFTRSFLFPVYRAWLPVAMLSGELTLDSRDPRRFRDAAFLGRGWAWIDPLKEAQAAEIALRNRFTSLQRILGQEGGDLEEIVEEIEESQELFAEHGVAPPPATAANPASPAQPSAPPPPDPTEVDGEDDAVLPA